MLMVFRLRRGQTRSWSSLARGRCVFLQYLVVCCQMDFCEGSETLSKNCYRFLGLFAHTRTPWMASGPAISLPLLTPSPDLASSRVQLCQAHPQSPSLPTRPGNQHPAANTHSPLGPRAASCFVRPSKCCQITCVCMCVPGVSAWQQKGTGGT